MVVYVVILQVCLHPSVPPRNIRFRKVMRSLCASLIIRRGKNCIERPWILWGPDQGILVIIGYELSYKASNGSNPNFRGFSKTIDA